MSTYFKPSAACSRRKESLAGNTINPWQLHRGYGAVFDRPSPASWVMPLMLLGAMFLHLLDMAKDKVACATPSSV
jgi:hypothetical protein